MNRWERWCKKYVDEFGKGGGYWSRVRPGVPMEGSRPAGGPWGDGRVGRGGAADGRPAGPGKTSIKK